ncbi:hypothetical protein EJMLMN_EJMLMN_17280, partial [Dysosmobacter welbionis]
MRTFAPGLQAPFRSLTGGNGDSVLFLTDQPQPCQSPGVLGARGDQVNPGRLNTGVAQDVRQLGHVPADTVERPGEQVPQIVGKHLAGCHARLVAQRFHLRPDLPAGDAFFVSGEKNLAGSDFLFPGVFEELAAELARQQDGPDLALQGDFGPSPVHGLHGDIAHLGHPDSCAADGFQQ